MNSEHLFDKSQSGRELLFNYSGIPVDLLCILSTENFCFAPQPSELGRKKPVLE